MQAMCTCVYPCVNMKISPHQVPSQPPVGPSYLRSQIPHQFLGEASPDTLGAIRSSWSSLSSSLHFFFLALTPVGNDIYFCDYLSNVCLSH